MPSKKKQKAIHDRHYLYTAAVQSVDADIDFFKRVYRKKNGERFRRLREDFCGTAALACDWVRRKDDNFALGVDIDADTLEWGKQHWVPPLDGASERLQLVCDDVRSVVEPKVDVIAALNFSYFVFKKREELLGYFRTARQSLLPNGILFLDLLGGAESMEPMRERRPIPSCKVPDGTRVPAFTYIWEQVKFNPVDHHLVCQIGFKLRDGKRFRKAFHYDWRLWTLPELHDLLLEAGFRTTEVYVEGWDDDADEADGVFRRRKRFENQAAWIAYMVGLT